jgi:hypothetical protein
MSRRAFALPLVLWCVAFLAAISLILTTSISRWLDDELLAERRFAARQQALSGLAVGLHPGIQPGDPILVTGDAERDGYAVRLTDESGRINPNYWLKGNQRDLFRDLFANWQVNLPDQDVAIDSMIDWMDPDEFTQLNGAEAPQYAAMGRAGFPPNRPFSSVREMNSVRGLSRILSGRDDWKDLFTVWYEGEISALHATAPVLEAVAGLTPEQARSFLEFRAGDDGLEGTKDDRTFRGMEEIITLVNANGLQAERLGKYFDLGSGVRRIESTGWVAGASYRVSVIVAEGGSFLHWEER